jgi:hypothetical protein
VVTLRLKRQDLQVLTINSWHLTRDDYSNEQLQVDLFGINVGKHDANISPELQSTLQSANLHNGWKDITGPDGKLMDISHSLVALDAYNSSPGFTGYLKSELFTDVGDLATGVFSAFGATGAGGMNMSDFRGNGFGSNLVGNRISNGTRYSLSEMLQQGNAARTNTVSNRYTYGAEQPTTPSMLDNSGPKIRTLPSTTSSAQTFEDDWWSHQSTSSSNDLDDDF